jgi:molecular chaperone DnaK
MAPERTVRSIKRKMGQDVSVSLGEQSSRPQEISAIVLRTLRERAEKSLGQPVKKAVIAVPAFFDEVQRDATREAGELAGLEVVRIINEPTAAVLTYDAHPPEMERLLVYDLGGGTFDVSIAQVEQGVVEILSSHGDTQLGGDDFDQRLLDFVCDRFHAEHDVELRSSLVARSRLMAAVEEAKQRLSFEPIVTIEEAFIAEKDGVPLNLRAEVTRDAYERLIEPLLAKTLQCLDDALTDAKLQAQQVDKVLCRAAQELSETCRRCKCDLRLVQDTVRAYRAHRAGCLAALRDGDVVEALVHAGGGVRLDANHESLKLLAVCALVAGDWRAALSAAQRAA